MGFNWYPKGGPWVAHGWPMGLLWWPIRNPWVIRGVTQVNSWVDHGLALPLLYI